MGSYAHSLSFRARHASNDLAIVPNALGRAAQVIWKAGDARQTPKGGPLEGFRQESYCSIEFEALQDLPQSIETALAVLKGQVALLGSLADDGVQFAFSVGWFSEASSGDTLPWQLLSDLADLRISLELTFYDTEQAM